MFTLTNDRRMLLDAAYAYSFEEEPEDEFLMDRYDVLKQFIHIFPEKFREPIQSHTLFEHNILMAAFQAWCEEIILTVGGEMDASYDRREAIVSKFSPSGRHVFSHTLHDGHILKHGLRGDDFVMLLDMSGGFTVEAIILLTFKNATFEGHLDPYYVYDELVEANDRFGLRILSSGGYPFDEATIFFDDIVAQYYYRPSVYVEPNGAETWDAFVAALKPDDRYVIVENGAFVEVELALFTETTDGIFAGEYFLGRHFEDARERIYCATYEDPYAHFSEELPIEELEAAVFGDDQTLKVRAFNTIFARGEEVADLVNDILRKAVVVEDEMYFSIMASHFYQLGCLREENRVKWDAS